MSDFVKTQFTQFEIIMYEEPTLDYISSLGAQQYAWICHDKDIWTFDDELENSSHKTGDLKKKHWHLFIRLDRRRTINGFLKLSNQPPQLVKVKDNMGATIRYFIHYGYEDKYQYDKLDIHTNIDINPFFVPPMNDNQFIMLIIQLVEENENSEYKFKFKDLCRYAILYNKLELISKRTYFFKMLLKGE